MTMQGDPLVRIFFAEQAARADDSETGSSAERFIEQASRQKPAAAQPVSEAAQVPEQSGESVLLKSLVLLAFLQS